MRFLLSLTLAVGVGGTLVSAEKSAAELLVEKLGDDSYREREAASRELLKLGVKALESLDKAGQHAEPETRFRAASLAAQIRRAEENAKRLAAPTLTLDYTGVPLSTIVADLKSRTGIPLQLDQTGVTDPLRTITLKSGPIPPWEAVEKLCQVANLREVFREDLSAKRDSNPFQDFRRRRMEYLAPNPQPLLASAVPIVLVDGKPESLPGNRSSLVRVLALPSHFSGNRVIRGSGEVILNLDVTPTPKAQWVGVAGFRIHRAIDDSGRIVSTAHHSNIPEDAEDLGVYVGNIDLDLGGMSGSPVNPRLVPIRLRIGDRLVSRLKLLEGVVVGESYISNQTLAVIDRMPKNVGYTTQAEGDSKVTLVTYDAKPDGRVCVRIRTETPNLINEVANGRVAWHSTSRNPFGQLRFYDAKGKLLRQPTVSETSINDDGITQSTEFQLNFPKPTAEAGPPVKLFLVGNKPTRLEVPFRLENVRLQ